MKLGGEMVYYNLTTRQKDILKYILESKDYINTQELEEEFNISKRTLANEIVKLKEFCAERNTKLISKRGLGYKFIAENENRKRIIIDSLNEKSFVYGNDGNRVNDILEILISRNFSQNNKAIKLEELARELYVSLSTIKQDIKEVKKILKKYNLGIIRISNYGVSLIGSEIDIRVFISNYLFKNSKEFKYLNANDFNFSVSNDNSIYESISNIVLDIVKKYEIELSDLGFKNLCIHIIIAIYRVKKNNFITYSNLSCNKEDKEYEAAVELKRMLDLHFLINLPYEEVIYLYQHLISQKMLLLDTNIDKHYKDNYIDNLFKYCLGLVYEYSGINFFNDKILKSGLLIHLRSAINRINFGMKIENTMLDDIKANYTFDYDIAIVFCEGLRKKANIEISEDEVGFITLHFAGAVERLKLVNKIHKYRTIVVCATGGGTAILLKTKLENKFNEFIEIEGFYPAFKLNSMDLSKYDLIISTIPLENVNLPVLNVSPIMLEEDCRKITRFITSNKNNDLKKNLFKEDLFFVDLDLEDKNEIIEYLSKAIYEKGYIDYEVANSFKKREELSSTEIGNKVAIPHFIKGEVNTESIAVAILKNPIKWDKTKVQLVMMLALKLGKGSEKLFLEIYSGIDDINKVNKLINCESFKEFKEIYGD